MYDLHAWLRRQIDADEKTAREAVRTSGHYTWSASRAGGGETDIETWSVEARGSEDGVPDQVDGDLFRWTGHRDLVEYVVRQDPHAVIADAVAKKELLTTYAMWSMGASPRRRKGKTGPLDGLSEAIRLIAYGYRHRPGWNPDWEK